MIERSAGIGHAPAFSVHLQHLVVDLEVRAERGPEEIIVDLLELVEELRIRARGSEGEEGRRVGAGALAQELHGLFNLALAAERGEFRGARRRPHRRRRWRRPRRGLVGGSPGIEGGALVPLARISAAAVGEGAGVGGRRLRSRTVEAVGGGGGGGGEGASGEKGSRDGKREGFQGFEEEGGGRGGEEAHLGEGGGDHGVRGGAVDRGEGGGRHFRDEEEEKTLGFRSLRGERGKRRFGFRRT